MRAVILSLADFALLTFAFIFSPVLRVAGRYRHRFSRFHSFADRAGFQIRTTHYYEPTYAEKDLPAQTSQPRSLPGLNMCESNQLALLEQFSFADELAAIPDVSPGVGQFGYRNNMYSFGDAEIYYSMVRLFKPKRIIEIGSGNSTLVSRMAVDRNRLDENQYSCQQICIEPYEMPWLESTGVTVMRERVESIDLANFDILEAGDFLFIDSSHIIRPWGDVLREFLEIIPRLKSGVYVHVHDIFTPFDYPEHWLRQERRLWNEQYLLEAFLSFNEQFEIVCATNWLKNFHWEAFCAACPKMREHPEQAPGAFWFKAR